MIRAIIATWSSHTAGSPGNSAFDDAGRAAVTHHFGVPIIAISRLERGHQRNEPLAHNYRQWLTAA